MGEIYPGASDAERWAKDVELRTREIAVQERTQAAKEREVELASQRERTERWRNPLTVAILAAALAGFSNAYIARENNRAQLDLAAAKADADRNLEEVRAEAQRILEMVKTGDPARAVENIRFLVELGLVRPELRQRIETWRNDPNRAEVYLPASAADIARFQRQRGMPADRRAGPATRAEMERARREAGEPPPTEW